MIKNIKENNQIFDRIDADKLRRKFSKYNLRYWDCRIEEDKTKEIVAWNKELRRNLTSMSRGFSIRVLYKNGWGFASSTNFSKLDEMINRALKLSKLNNTKEKVYLNIPKQVNDKKITKQKIKFNNVSNKEKVSQLLKLCKKGLDYDKNIKSILTKYVEILEKKKFISSLSFVEQELSRGAIKGVVNSKSSNRQEEKNFSVGNMGGYEFCENIEQEIIDACKRAVDFLKAKKGIPGNFPIILDGVLANLLVHEALGHASEADTILQDSGCLIGKKGKRLAKENVNICDDPSENNFSGWGSYYYDDEGVKGIKTYIIKEGILNSYLHNIESAGKLKSNLTGNARAESVFRIPVIRMSNTYIETGNSSFEEMLKQIKNGYYMKGSKGGQVDPSIGAFQFSAQDIYKIKNGEIKDKIKGMSFGGNLLDILKNIELIDKEYNDVFPGTCGKAGQHVPVGGKCPKVFLKKAMVN
jgi:TldD protein